MCFTYKLTDNSIYKLTDSPTYKLTDNSTDPNRLAGESTSSTYKSTEPQTMRSTYKLTGGLRVGKATDSAGVCCCTVALNCVANL